MKARREDAAADAAADTAADAAMDDDDDGNDLGCGGDGTTTPATATHRDR